MRDHLTFPPPLSCITCGAEHYTVVSVENVSICFPEDDTGQQSVFSNIPVQLLSCNFCGTYLYQAPENISIPIPHEKG